MIIKTDETLRLDLLCCPFAAAELCVCVCLCVCTHQYRTSANKPEDGSSQLLLAFEMRRTFRELPQRFLKKKHTFVLKLPDDKFHLLPTIKSIKTNR